MTVALTIRNAAVTALRASAVAGIPSTRVYVDLADGLAKANRPALVVDMGDDQIERRDYGKQLRQLSLQLRVIADGSDAYATVEPILDAANTRVLTDTALAGLVDSLEHSGISRQQAEQGGLAMATITILARYRVDANSL
jgi:hypothetical protein